MNTNDNSMYLRCRTFSRYVVLLLVGLTLGHLFILFVKSISLCFMTFILEQEERDQYRGISHILLNKGPFLSL